MKNMIFSQWLVSEMESRKLNQSDLARAVRIDQAAVSRLVSGKAQPSPDTLNSLARVFELPPIVVFRAAGLLPNDPDVDEEIEQILHEVDKLPKADQEEVLAFIRMKRNLRKKGK